MCAALAGQEYAESRSNPQEYVEALVNILDDFAQEKNHLQETQAAVLNILGDFTAEKQQLRSMQSAVMNILEDAQTEKIRLESTQAAILNIMDDSAAEKEHLQNIQKAIFNIFDDLHVEKRTLEETRNQLLRSSQEVLESHRHLEQRVQERTAELAASNKELGAFAYSVSHDLRAPLRHLDGFLTLLRQRSYDTLDDSSRHYIDAVLTASKRMGTLIDDLLQFSRLGRASMRKEVVMLNDIVTALKMELQHEIQGRKVLWNVGSLPPVTADRGMMHQVFQNLLANALKFTRTRQQAEIIITGALDEAGNVIVSVADNGVGFDMAYYDKLFQVFQRLHGENEFEGTGIGLANVRKIVERHDGRVWARSTLGTGTTFYVSLPTAATMQTGDEHESVKAHFTG